MLDSLRTPARRRWTAATGSAAVAAIAALYRFSPWPRVLLLRFFSNGGTGLLSHAPRPGRANIAAHLDLNYSDSRPDCRLDVYRPRGGGPLPAIVWIHGGGFVNGTKEPLRHYLSVLASHGFAAVNVEYTKAPEASHPTQVDQVRLAVEYVVAHAEHLGIDARQLVLAGDSAGAHMVSQAVLAATDASYAARLGVSEVLDADRVAGVALASGPHDMEALLQIGGPFTWYLRTVLWAYTGARNFTRDARFGLASIVEHVHPTFPPTFLTSGPKDPFAVQSHSLADRLREIGVDVDEVVLDDDSRSGHVFDFDFRNPDARVAAGRLVAFLRRVTTARQLVGVTDSW